MKLYTFFQRYFFRFRVSFQRSSRTLYFGRTFPAFEYLRTASRTLLGLFDEAFFFSGTFSASEYLRSALEDSSMTLFFSGTFPVSEYLRSASRTLERLFDDALFLAVLSPLPSICAAPWRTLGGLFILDVLSPLFRVPAQLVQIFMI